MQGSIRVRGDDFNYDFFNKLKTLIEGKDVIINIEVDEPMDDTSYLMDSAENLKQLMDSIERINKKENLVTVSMETLL